MFSPITLPTLPLAENIQRPSTLSMQRTSQRGRSTNCFRKCQDEGVRYCLAVCSLARCLLARDRLIGQRPQQPWNRLAMDLYPPLHPLVDASPCPRTIWSRRQ
jgi:hypothetical protein